MRLSVRRIARNITRKTIHLAIPRGLITKMHWDRKTAPTWGRKKNYRNCIIPFRVVRVRWDKPGSWGEPGGSPFPVSCLSSRGNRLRRDAFSSYSKSSWNLAFNGVVSYTGGWALRFARSPSASPRWFSAGRGRRGQRGSKFLAPSDTVIVRRTTSDGSARL